MCWQVIQVCFNLNRWERGPSGPRNRLEELGVQSWDTRLGQPALESGQGRQTPKHLRQAGFENLQFLVARSQSFEELWRVK
jgi:hypothetical protein